MSLYCGGHQVTSGRCRVTPTYNRTARQNEPSNIRLVTPLKDIKHPRYAANTSPASTARRRVPCRADIRPSFGVRRTTSARRIRRRRARSRKCADRKGLARCRSCYFELCVLFWLTFCGSRGFFAVFLVKFSCFPHFLLMYLY